ncbi:MAG: hypothetical protein HY751_05315 [Nitrospinae bacterium]|nr:hypothetical protein [Nitrospinota bacterium]
MPRTVSDKVVDYLCALYNAEIGAIGIYMDQHVKLDNAGFSKLAEGRKEDAKEEMRHAEMLAERITYLGRNVKYSKHEIPREEMVEIADMLRWNIQLENEAIEMYNEGIRLCAAENDNGSRLLMEGILRDEEKHLGTSETQLENLEKYGTHYIVGQLM